MTICGHTDREWQKEAGENCTTNDLHSIVTISLSNIIMTLHIAAFLDFIFRLILKYEQCFESWLCPYHQDEL
jgi:hypothetical protein